jgi:hypothetical protein
MIKYILLILFALMITACEESKIQPVIDTDAEDNDTVIEPDETADIAVDYDPDKEVDDENIIDDVDVYNDPDIVFDDFLPDENDETLILTMQATNHAHIFSADRMKIQGLPGTSAKIFITVKG